jgi:hypothetical protein
MKHSFSNDIDFLFRHRLQISIVFCSILASVALFDIATEDRQHDFRTYYSAAQIYTLGGNPYDAGSLSPVAGREVRFPFLYPPVTLQIWKLFSQFDFQTSYYLFLFLKLVSMAGLIVLWSGYFCKGRTERSLMLIFIIFAFHGTVLRDFNAGNISVFEQLFMWAGLFALLRERYSLSAVLFIIGTLSKPLTLLLFLPLSLVVIRKRKWNFFAAAIGLFVFIHGLSYYFEPGLFHEYINHARLITERGFENPSTYTFLQDVFDYLSAHLQIHLSMLSFPFYIITAASVLIVGFAAMRKLDLMDALILVLLMYALIVPRFKDYSYILLIVPAVSVIAKRIPSTMIQLFTTFLVCTHVVRYQSLFCAFWLFSLFLWDAFPIADLLRRRKGIASFF